MAFIRIKKIKRYNYLYLVKNTWTDKGARQKVLKYYGKIDIGKINEQAIFDRDKKCQVCQGTENLVIDHKILLTLGGRNDYDNLWVLCGKCNAKKNDMKFKDGKLVKVSEREKIYHQLQLLMQAYTNEYKKTHPNAKEQEIRRSVLRRKDIRKMVEKSITFI